MPRRSIDHPLIEGPPEEGKAEIDISAGGLVGGRGSVSSAISRPSGMAVHGAVMHIMGGMCTCRGSQLFDTAAGGFAIRAAPLSPARIARIGLWPSPSFPSPISLLARTSDLPLAHLEVIETKIAILRALKEQGRKLNRDEAFSSGRNCVVIIVRI